MALYENTWQAVRARVDVAARRAGRDPASVSILPVSKGQPATSIRAAYGLGARAFGENYVQEALAKMDALDDLAHIDWHLIGPLQGNKARAAASRFRWVQSVDRFAIAQRLSDARPTGSAALNVCVQVNISGEERKHGCAPDAALALIDEVARLPRLALRGFMGIAQESVDAQQQRSQFATLRALYERARSAGFELDTLSMGMSADLEAAIAEGATMVRVGSALFGPRSRASPDSRLSHTGDPGTDRTDA
jgi:PLP dependent protein